MGSTFCCCMKRDYQSTTDILETKANERWGSQPNKHFSKYGQKGIHISKPTYTHTTTNPITLDNDWDHIEYSPYRYHYRHGAPENEGITSFSYKAESNEPSNDSIQGSEIDIEYSTYRYDYKHSALQNKVNAAFSCETESSEQSLSSTSSKHNQKGTHFSKPKYTHITTNPIALNNDGDDIECSTYRFDYEHGSSQSEGITSFSHETESNEHSNDSIQGSKITHTEEPKSVESDDKAVIIGTVFKTDASYKTPEFDIKRLLKTWDTNIACKEVISLLEHFSIQLDKKFEMPISLTNAIKNDVDIILRQMCIQINAKEYSKRIDRMHVHTYKLVGSMFACVNVGYPIEIDIALLHHGKCSSSYFKGLVEGIIKHILPNRRWTLIRTDEHRSGLCLTFKYKHKDEKLSTWSTYGVQIDLIPMKIKTINVVTLRPEAKLFLERIGLLDNFLEYQYFLSYSNKDMIDTGVIVNEIISKLDNDQKRGLRFAKYLLKYFVHQCDRNLHTGRDECILRLKSSLRKQQELELYGYKPGIKSFYPTNILIHILIQTQNSLLEFRGATLALCLLEVLHNIVNTETELPDFCFIMNNPFFEGYVETSWASRKVCQSIDELFDQIIDDAYTGTMDSYSTEFTKCKKCSDSEHYNDSDSLSISDKSSYGSSLSSRRKPKIKQNRRKKVNTLIQFLTETHVASRNLAEVIVRV